MSQTWTVNWELCSPGRVRSPGPYAPVRHHQQISNTSCMDGNINNMALLLFVIMLCTESSLQLSNMLLTTHAATLPQLVSSRAATSQELQHVIIIIASAPPKWFHRNPLYCCSRPSLLLAFIGIVVANCTLHVVMKCWQQAVLRLQSQGNKLLNLVGSLFAWTLIEWKMKHETSFWTCYIDCLHKQEETW